MHTFRVETPAAVGGQISLPEGEAAHALRVLRLTSGEAICVVDSAHHRYRAVLEAEDGRCAARILEALPDNEPPVRITLYQGVPKADKLELVTQKAVELGVFAIEPVWMEHCVVKAERREADRRQERLARIAREAVKQCRRGAEPRIGSGLRWEDALEQLRRHALVMVPWENAEGLRMRDVYAQRPEVRDLALLIGPEGGISPREAEALRNQGAQLITLGPRILRTETAAIAAVAAAMDLWGDL